MNVSANQTERGGGELIGRLDRLEGSKTIERDAQTAGAFQQEEDSRRGRG